MNAAPVSAGDHNGLMIYLETSVVVALLTPEERSPHALDWSAATGCSPRPTAPWGSSSAITVSAH